MKEILTVLGGIAGVAFLVFQFASPMLMQRKLKRIASLPTDELKALFPPPYRPQPVARNRTAGCPCLTHPSASSHQPGPCPSAIVAAGDRG